MQRWNEQVVEDKNWTNNNNDDNDAAADDDDDNDDAHEDDDDDNNNNISNWTNLPVNHGRECRHVLKTFRHLLLNAKIKKDEILIYSTFEWKKKPPKANHLFVALAMASFVISLHPRSANLKWTWTLGYYFFRDSTHCNPQSSRTSDWNRTKVPVRWSDIFFQK